MEAASNAESSVWILNFYNLLSGTTETAIDKNRLFFLTYDAYDINKSSLSHVNMYISIEKSS